MEENIAEDGAKKNFHRPRGGPDEADIEAK